MTKQNKILNIIRLLGLGFFIKILLDVVNMSSNNLNYNNLVASGDLSSTRYVSVSNRNAIKEIVSRVYKNILRVNVSSSTLNSWTNKLSSKQSTLYDFLTSVITPRINQLNTTSLARYLYQSILGRSATTTESSRLVSTFNDELRNYGSRERALRKMVTYFVKMSSVVSYCNKLGIKAI